MSVLISICIPAYQNPELIARLLNSIVIQSFRNFEVIVTDDSPGNAIELICHSFTEKFKIQYYKNPVALGSPANWNAAIAMASGEWIKIMHHDDWFDGSEALAAFAEKANHDEGNFIFSGYNLVNENGHITPISISGSTLSAIRKDPLHLFKKNYLGHPSTSLIKREHHLSYDEQIKWVVDFEFYIRSLQNEQLVYIDKLLVNLGLGKHQVTSEAFRNAEVEIPENLYLLNKLGVEIFKNIYVYDYYWRLIRNLEVRKISDVEKFAAGNQIPSEFSEMMKFQFKFPLKLLQNGLFSKSLMGISYIKHRFKPGI